MSRTNGSSASLVAALSSAIVHAPVSLCIFTLSSIAMIRYLVRPRRLHAVCRTVFRRLELLAELGYNLAGLGSPKCSDGSDSDSAGDSDAETAKDAPNYASGAGNIVLDGAATEDDDDHDDDDEDDEDYKSTSDTDSEHRVEAYLNDYYTELHKNLQAAAPPTLSADQRLPSRACFIIGANDSDDSGNEDTASDRAIVPAVAATPAEDEPLLDQTVDEDRFLLFPIKHQDLFDLYKLQVAQFWTAEEINLTKDVHDWQLLTPVEQNFFKRILAFFAPSDGIVGENLITRFYNDIGYTEAKYFYVFQAMMENIHAEVYGLLIKNLIPSDREQNELFRAFATTPGIREKVEWAEYWLHSDRLFVERLVAFSVVEGLLFSGSFASIFWLKKKGILPGLTFSNELISRDESLHCDFACHLYTKHVKHQLPASRVQDMVRGAVNAETVFFAHAFAAGPVGEMNQDTMLTYVKFCADRLLLALNCEPIYQVANPFEFMHLISLDGRTNFFERRVGDYRQSMVSTSNITDDKIHLPGGRIDLSDDF